LSGTNQFYAWATAPGANVLSNTQLQTLISTLSNAGFGPGVLSSINYNSIARQPTFVAAAIGQTIADATGGNVNDDGSIANFEKNLQQWLGIGAYAIDSGVANNYVVTYPIPVLSLQDGLEVAFKASNTNTSSSTLNVSGLGSSTIYNYAHSPLMGGEIGAGGIVSVVYNSSLPGWLLLESTNGASQLPANSYVQSSPVATDSTTKIATTAFVNTVATNIVASPAASITLNNAQSLKGKYTGGTADTIVGVDSSNNTFLGSSNTGATATVVKYNGTSGISVGASGQVTLPNQTIAQFDASTNAATTAYVQSSLGNMNGNFGSTANTTQTIPASYYGRFLEYAGTANNTWNIPTAAGKGGATFTIWNNSGYVLTLSSAGGNFYSSKGSSASTLQLSAGAIYTIISDNFNWIVLSSTVGSFINSQVFTSSGTYTPSVGTRSIIVEAVGGGGGCGGTPATSSSQTGGNSPGNSGSYVKVYLSGIAQGATYAVTVGAGGSGGAAGTGTGGTGGTTSFGSIISCPGSSGSAVGVVAAGPIQLGSPGTSSNPTVTSGLTILLKTSATAGAMQATAGTATGFVPLPSNFPGTGYGMGGFGAFQPASAAAVAGNAGFQGVLVVHEYA
jgi:hypothetical protein